jgi:DNA-binding NarL/FixJ family response regulator
MQFATSVPDAQEATSTCDIAAMLRRKNGATLSEIMKTMGWQKHTVRGFMAGAMKKAGHAVESFKPEGGERTYRRILKERHPSIAPVMLTVFKDDDRIFQAICAGTCGYLLKQTPPGRLMEAVKQIAEGGAVMSPEVAMRVVELFRQAPPREAGSAGLSPQEMRLLKLLTKGHHTKTAAAELGISVHTVTFHLRSIYEKLHVHSRSEAVARALRDGLVH